MPYRFRVGSFNCENFFSRARLLNFDDNAKAKPFLEAAVQLDSELALQVYNPATILNLYKKLSRYVMVRENKGKLFSGTGAKRKVVAKGRDDREGSIELLRDDIMPEGQINTVRIVKEVNPDILCVVEIEDRRVLERLGNSQLLGQGKYQHSMLIDGNDPRGIDVGVLSRLPIEELRSHIDDRDPKGRVFSRDCLETRIVLGNGKPLWLLANHLKSQGYGKKADNDAKRTRQARRVADILKARFDLTKDLVIVAGDFNDSPQSPPLSPLLSNPHLHNVVAEQQPTDSWTYAYRGKTEQIDYLLVSEPLKQAMVGVGIERRGMFGIDKLTNGKIQPLSTIKKPKDAASDHAAIHADFNLT